MRTFLIVVTLLAFLYSDWAPAWGGYAATGILILYGLSKWGKFTKGGPSTPNRTRDPNNPYDIY